MIQTTHLNRNSDIYGSLASALCIIHCLASPLLFVTTALDKTCAHTSPWWWRMIDILFLFISFLAIRQSVQNSSHSWIPKAMYSSWFLLTIVILIDRVTFIKTPHLIIHLLALSLVALHLYNLKYCKCRGDKCCINHENKTV